MADWTKNMNHAAAYSKTFAVNLCEVLCLSGEDCLFLDKGAHPGSYAIRRELDDGTSEWLNPGNEAEEYHLANS